MRMLLITGSYKNSGASEGLQNHGLISKKIRTLPHSKTSLNIRKFSVNGEFLLKIFRFIQVGGGLMALQQFGGVNAIAYYASAIFSSAGKLILS